VFWEGNAAPKKESEASQEMKEREVRPGRELGEHSESRLECPIRRGERDEAASRGNSKEKTKPPLAGSQKKTSRSKRRRRPL